MNTHSKKHAQPSPHAEAKPVAFGPVERGIPVSPESIRARAYQIFQNRIRTQRSGDAISDWLQAERELTGRPGQQNAAIGDGGRAQARGETLLAGISN